MIEAWWRTIQAWWQYAKPVQCGVCHGWFAQGDFDGGDRNILRLVCSENCDAEISGVSCYGELSCPSLDRLSPRSCRTCAKLDQEKP